MYILSAQQQKLDTELGNEVMREMGNKGGFGTSQI